MSIKKKVIEFNGDFWHGNPSFYEPEYILEVQNIKASDVWERDKIKQNKAIKKGYEILIIWENEYNKNPKQCIDKCIEFLLK